MKYRIREQRKNRGLTLDQLAEMVGTSKGYLSDLETGKRTGGIDMLRAIAQALNVSDAEIFMAESIEEQQILDHVAIFQKLSPEDRQAIARMAKGLLNAPGQQSE